MKVIPYSKHAAKALRGMPANTAQTIVGKSKANFASPESQSNNVKALRGRDGIRLRVGNWRVIMQDGQVLAVLDSNPARRRV
jgi:mRNA interferase RelE/StbE